MSELLTIPGLDQPAAELLEAAGFFEFKDLAEADDQALARELERANRILKIAESAPSHDAVADWVRYAREQTGITVEEVVVALVDHEQDAEVADLLRTSPLAIPLPGNLLKDKGLSVPDIPSGLLLNQYPGDLNIRLEKRIPEARVDADAHSSYVQIAERFAQSKLNIDVARLKSINDMDSVRPRMLAMSGSQSDDRVALIRAPKESTNEGRDPESRRFIRGILHSHPRAISFGAFLTLVMIVEVPLAVFSALLLLLSRENPNSFGWVAKWWLAFPMVLPVIAFAWFIWGFSGKCRVCGQRLFVHRPHRKNAKAHYLPGLGYVVPLCVHILFFHWFRCSHCGTPLRLKK